MKLFKKCLFLSLLVNILGFQAMEANGFITTKNIALEAFKSVSKTIKTDLGFDVVKEVSQNLVSPQSLINDFKIGCRLTCYGIVTQLTVLAVLSQLTQLDDTRVQSESSQKSNFLDTVIIRPVQEEVMFTYGLSTILGKTYGPLITPLAFGAMHYRDNPKTWALFALMSGINSFYRTRNAHAYDNMTLAPIFSHMIRNAISYL